MTHYGYCRLKKENQTTDNQHDTLLSAGILIENIFKDIVVGQSKRLPQFDKLMSLINIGDSITVFDIDLLGQTLEKRMITLYDFSTKGIILNSINDCFNSATKEGKIMMNAFELLGQKELNRKKPIRTMQGLKDAKQRGFSGGRPEGMTEEAEKIAKEVKRLIREEKMHRIKVMKLLDISLGTFYKYLRYQPILVKPNKPENNVE